MRFDARFLVEVGLAISVVVIAAGYRAFALPEALGERFGSEVKKVQSRIEDERMVTPLLDALETSFADLRKTGWFGRETVDPKELSGAVDRALTGPHTIESRRAYRDYFELENLLAAAQQPYGVLKIVVGLSLLPLVYLTLLVSQTSGPDIPDAVDWVVFAFVVQLVLAGVAAEAVGFRRTRTLRRRLSGDGNE